MCTVVEGHLLACLIPGRASRRTDNVAIADCDRVRAGEQSSDVEPAIRFESATSESLHTSTPISRALYLANDFANNATLSTIATQCPHEVQPVYSLDPRRTARLAERSIAKLVGWAIARPKTAIRPRGRVKRSMKAHRSRLPDLRPERSLLRRRQIGW